MAGRPLIGEPYPHGEAALSVRDMVLAHDRAIDDLTAWRSELRGAFQLVKVTLGVSVISAIVSMAALITMITTGRP